MATEWEGTSVFEWLPQAWQAELVDLADHYGAPLMRGIESSAPEYLRQISSNRQAEVCMVVRRPSGGLLTMSKTFYPADVYRLLTGGVEQDEPILDALRRETLEETGLATEVVRFLAAVEHRAEAVPCFASFAFLVHETGGTLGALDPHERVLGYRDVAMAELPAIIAQLSNLGSDSHPAITTSWRDWGQFRIPIHQAVFDALREDAADGRV